MAVARWGGMTLVALLVVACGGGDETGVVEPPVTPCRPGTLTASDGRCLPVGIPTDGCAPGFDHIEDACVPILPVDACAPGEMALPGETSCRPVAPCDGSRWGAAPIDASTVFVDRSFTGVPSGSEAAPWPSIAEAIAQAASGALIAIAAGSYVEDVGISGKSLRLWGSCPAEVEIVGSAGAIAAIDVRNGADGSEIHDLAIRGGAWGFGASGAMSLLVERVYIHDTGGRAFGVEGTLGLTSATLRDSLLEAATEYGAIAIGADLVVERSVVRDTRSTTAGAFGRGIESSYDPVDGDHAFALSGSLIERNHEVGVYVAGHSATIDASVIRDTFPHADGTAGRGLMCQLSLGTTSRCSMQLSRSVLQRNHEFGFYLGSSEATVEATVIRDTIEGALHVGRGVDANEMPEAPGIRAYLTLRDSLVTGNTQHGVNVIASDALIERTLVRDNLPQQSTGWWGEGIMIQTSLLTLAPALVTVQSCAVERNLDFGILVVASSASIVDSAVRATSGQAADGLFGDGIAVAAYQAPASCSVVDSRIEHSQRAGIANFGGSFALGSSAIDCSAIDIASEPLDGALPQFDDQGQNRCGCGDERVDCQVASVGLDPPRPLE